jgi:hypothetical protein
MAITTTPGKSAEAAESSLLAKMTAALGPQGRVDGVAINRLTGVVDVAVGMPSDLCGPELDIRYTWIRWNLESLIAQDHGAGGLRLGDVHTV